jgi:uncharacterized protein
MNSDVIEAQLRAVLPLEGSFAIFLGNGQKTFVIYVDESVGSAISMYMRGVSKERPLTHDLMGTVLMAFGGKVERIIINDVQGSVFFARIIIVAENQLHARKLIELDARPSDSIALSILQKSPIYVARRVWNEVEDVTSTLEEIEKRGLKETDASAEGSEDDEAEDQDDEDEEEDDDEEMDEIDLEVLAELEDDDDEEEDENFEDGYNPVDDDDDEGEEWKKGK